MAITERNVISRYDICFNLIFLYVAILDSRYKRSGREILWLDIKRKSGIIKFDWHFHASKRRTNLLLDKIVK